MCRFASFVLTKDREYWSDSSDSHAQIIDENGLHEWGAQGPNVVKVEITPTDEIRKWPDLSAWKFCIDQDVLPEWYDAETTEKRAREALRRRYRDGFKVVNARGCTALTSLKADAAETVDVRGCTALTKLKADAAKYVDASDCTALKELKADAAEYVDARGCTDKLFIGVQKGCVIRR